MWAGCTAAQRSIYQQREAATRLECVVHLRHDGHLKRTDDVYKGRKHRLESEERSMQAVVAIHARGTQWCNGRTSTRHDTPTVCATRMCSSSGMTRGTSSAPAATAASTPARQAATTLGAASSNHCGAHQHVMLSVCHAITMTIECFGPIARRNVIHYACVPNIT
jgi:hypothetical protein